MDISHLSLFDFYDQRRRITKKIIRKKWGEVGKKTDKCRVEQVPTNALLQEGGGRFVVSWVGFLFISSDFAPQTLGVFQLSSHV